MGNEMKRSLKRIELENVREQIRVLEMVIDMLHISLEEEENSKNKYGTCKIDTLKELKERYKRIEEELKYDEINIRV